MKPDITAPANMTRRDFLAISAATAVSASIGDQSVRKESGTNAASGSPEALTKETLGTLPLIGSDWYIHEGVDKKNENSELYEAEVSENDWIPARVPGNIQADLERSHYLGPLWYGGGDPRLVEVAQKDWWYRKDFILPVDLRKKRLTLVFDGVDFEYEVWLNGKQLGTGAGQFRRFEFDATGAARLGQKNRLAVKIARMPDEIVHCLKASDGALSGLESPNWFITCYIHSRQVLQGLKSISNFSYDWGVNIYTLGLWRDVWLEATGSTRIEWVYVRTELLDENQKATVVSHLELDSRVPLRARAVFRVRGQSAGTDVSVTSSLQQGKNTIDARIPLNKPSLWWPNGHGDQPLYELEVGLEDADSGETLDSKTVRFAIREVRWELTEGAPPNFINPYRLIVNGRPIRMMGSDMTSPDLLFGRNSERWPRLVHLAKAAGINTLRMHGAGVTLPPGFYDKTDELGIMLSHEFPLANSWPETGPVFLSNLEATTSDIVKQLRNHTSIVEWVGGNEMPWEQGTDHPALHVLERVCAKNDRRIFRATDPMQGSKHSPWTYNPRTHYAHYNRILESLVLPNPELGVNTENAMRYGEFGTQTPTNLEVFQREIPPSSQWPLSDPYDPILVRKNVMQAAFTPVDWLMKEVVESFFGPFDKLEDLIKAGQFIGAEGLRYAFDELRRKGKRIGGLTSWDYNEPWPNGAGSYMVDYDGRTLMNYDFVKQALTSLSLALRYDSVLYDPSVGISATLWLVSDAPDATSNLIWKCIARDRRGRVIHRDAGTASILPQDARQMAEVKIKPPQETALGPILVELSLTDSNGKILAERLHIFGGDNAHVWPFDGLLRNKLRDDYDDSRLTSKQQTVRVLWIHDDNHDSYEDIAWYIRRFGIHSEHIQATAEAFEKVAPDIETLVLHFDVIWLGDGNYQETLSLSERLGERSLSVISQAVKAGLGLGVEGGWGGYADAGFSGTSLAEVLPVTFVGSGNSQRRGRSQVKIVNPSHPLVTGSLAKQFPEVSGYNVVRPKGSADVILRTKENDSLLCTQVYGRGRVLAYSSSIVGRLGWVEGSMVKDDAGELINWGWSLRAWSGYPFFIARMLSWLSGAPDRKVSAVDLPTEKTRLVRPVKRTNLLVTVTSRQVEGDNEILEFELRNFGDMTALFCEPHPLIEYRTDITIFDNHVHVPPGEKRLVRIVSPINASGGLSLAQTGWRFTSWNSDETLIPPSADVLLSVGRRDATCREYFGYSETQGGLLQKLAGTVLTVKGNRPDPSLIPWLLAGPEAYEARAMRLKAIRFIFEANQAQSTLPARLRIHAADQDKEHGPAIEACLNGSSIKLRLKPGLGIQLSDPAHLAFPHTAEFNFLPGALRPGPNILEIKVADKGWFSWDSMDLVTIRQDGG